MTKRTYNPDDYEPETQEAMTELRSWRLYSTVWNHSDIADVIERAVKKAKAVTGEQVRAGCAAVAEAHLKEPKP